jgi:hypothetical protein
MGKLVNLEEIGMNRVDSIVLDFLTVEKHSEGVIKLCQK